MRRFLILAVLVLLSLAGNAQALVPYPNGMVQAKGRAFVLNCNVPIIANGALQNEALYLQKNIKDTYGIDLALVSSGSTKTRINLSVDTTLYGYEQYVLKVDNSGISITGASSEAVFDGVATLLQLLESSERKDNTIAIKPVVIDDAPVYGYRALLLDPARHFLPKEDVERYIDEMARYKFNRLQLHLTDDQGWRMEIKSHPELTDGIAHYTQEDICELVSYAATRHIEIVPEIDIPGHTFALLKLHPEMLCDCVDTTAWGKDLRTDVMLCAGRPEVYTVVSDIVREVCMVFPSKFIHLGGDESLIEKNWAKCQACQALRKEQNIDSNNHLMGWFFAKVLPVVREMGKQPVLWCELDNIYYPAHEYLFDYPKDVTLVTWRNALSPKAMELTAKHGNNLIMAPGEHCYFDYPQAKNDLPEFNNWGMPVLSLKQAYNWEELEGSTTNIVGVMGTLWGEAIPDINRAFYMTYPRALALAEHGWTRQEFRNWDSFIKRLPVVLNGMMKRGVAYRVPFENYKICTR